MSLLRAPDGKGRLTLPTAECACGRNYVRLNSMQTKCVPCLRSIGPATRKAERADTAKRKESIKTRSDWLKEAQREFNAYIRARDADKPCISCGRNHQGQWHAGHYLSVGSRPELRFDEDNVHKQCQPCNTHLHGNLIAYRIGLSDRSGPAVLERLEGPHLAAKWSIDDLKAIRDDFRARVAIVREMA